MLSSAATPCNKVSDKRSHTYYTVPVHVCASMTHYQKHIEQVLGPRGSSIETIAITLRQQVPVCTVARIRLLTACRHYCSHSRKHTQLMEACTCTLYAPKSTCTCTCMCASTVDRYGMCTYYRILPSKRPPPFFDDPMVWLYMRYTYNWLLRVNAHPRFWPVNFKHPRRLIGRLRYMYVHVARSNKAVYTCIDLRTTVAKFHASRDSLSVILSLLALWCSMQAYTSTTNTCTCISCLACLGLKSICQSTTYMHTCPCSQSVNVNVLALRQVSPIRTHVHVRTTHVRMQALATEIMTLLSLLRLAPTITMAMN